MRPIYFTKLTLENIRCFSERQELKLADDDDRPAPWTLIVGDNGVGKTTLLQCLARMRPVFNYPSDDEQGSPSSPIEPEWATEEDNEVLNALARSSNAEPARLEAYLSIGALGHASETPLQETISTSLEITRTVDGFVGFNRDGTSSESVDKLEEPLVLGYGAGRHPRVLDVDKTTETDPIGSLFRVASELYDAEDLLYTLDYSSLKGRPDTKKQLDRLKEMLAALLPDIHDPQDIDILGPPRMPGNPPEQTGIRVKTPYGQVPLNQMSLGERTVLAWTVDIAWRLLDRYPDSENPFREPAIVIVDEIDLHLHPRWQREIRAHLTSHFPRIQFIATAHSPLMAQSSLDANLAVLQRSGDHAVILNDPSVIKSWRLDQLVTSELFDLESARSPEMEKRQKRRTELLEKPGLSPEDQVELAELDQMILEMPTESPDDERAMGIIRRAAAKIQSSESDS